MSLVCFLLVLASVLDNIYAATQFAFPERFDYRAVSSAFSTTNDKYLGHRRPYSHPPTTGLISNIPDGCEIVQVQALIRHGARNPTAVEWPAISRLTKVLKSDSISANPLIPDNPFAFLANWKRFLHKSSIGLLSVPGRSQAFSLGESFAERYKFGLFNKTLEYTIEYASASPPLLQTVLTKDQDRVEETARWFAFGFWGTNASESVSFHGIPETPASGARSLQPISSCPNFKTNVEDAVSKRLNKFICGHRFNEEDVYVLYELCVYEDAVLGRESPFCNLFTPEEFLAFEYLDDILFQQLDGPANEFSAPLGAPWVQRMGQRLRSNSYQKLYFSFGHDVTVYPVLTALGVLPKEAYTPLGTRAIQWHRAFRGGNLVPFCGNVIVEKLQCTKGDYVRVLNNQVPVPLEGCGNGPSGFSDGLCEIDEFLSQSVRKEAVRSGINWFERKCGLRYTTWQR